jgi:CBS domain-containing protein/gamma-glutamylcysteine synthetase
MSTKTIDSEFRGEGRRRFTQALLRDVGALERLLASGMIEEGVRRIGAEQEVFLVDSGLHPAPAAMNVLQALDDPRYTTELGLFQLEMNLEPQIFTGDCLSRMERQLEELLAKAREAASRTGVDLVLAGILPTIRKTDLGIESMVPNPRYHALNEAMSALRGRAYDIFIKGVDELRLTHESVMVEACNASFQVHFQSGAKEFANLYNIAQAIAGPVLAGATNSPILFGRQLWSETRIALFQQAVDTRSPTHQRESMPRVTFGERWLRQSVIEIYREDIARFRSLVGVDSDEDSVAKVERGETPELRALRLHNGTVYRWNRACYGITDGKPHLRIENRVFPSGPSVLDQIANAAFWYGIMNALATRYEDITRLIEFDHAKRNFVSAAREGLAARLRWFEREELSAPRLILDRLLPLAHEGLAAASVSDEDRERYLGVLEKRVRSGRTGARWLVDSLSGMQGHGTSGERLHALTAAMRARQESGAPVAEWEHAKLGDAGGWKHNYVRVEQYMETDMVTVHEDDPVALVVHLMEWHRVRHVPVEDSEHRLVGLVSYRSVFRLLKESRPGFDPSMVPVGNIMKRDPVSIGPTMHTLKAIDVMRRYRVGCLPVVHQDRLVGMVTVDEFVDIAGELLEEKLAE